MLIGPEISFWRYLKSNLPKLEIGVQSEAIPATTVNDKIAEIMN